MADLSIIVSCFMHEKYVEQAYWSAKNQIWDGEIEVIINHDGCARGIGSGAGAARNYAIKGTESPWIIVLDADDLLPRNYVRSLMPRDRDEDRSIRWFAGCPVQFISGTKLERFGNKAPGEYKIHDFKRHMPFIPSAALFSREGWELVGGFDEDPTFDALEDVAFWYKLMQNDYSYYHTPDTCLLKNNDGFGHMHRTQYSVRKGGIEKLNKMYGLSLQLPEVIR